MVKTNHIYIKPVGGLCNRMRTIDSCVSLALKHNKQVTIIWGRDRFLNCRFSDLFQSSESYHVVEENQYFGKKALFPYLPGSRPTSFLKSGLYKITKLVLRINKEIWFEYLDSALVPLRETPGPEQTINMKSFESKALVNLSPFISAIREVNNVFVCSAWRLWPEQNYRLRFVPTEFLRNKISEVTGQFNQTIGVHIRRSDHDLAIQNSGLNKFKEAMNRELHRNNKHTFFLATDCKETENELKKAYPGKIISFQKQSYNRNSTAGIQDALVDLYCLSKTAKVLGSYFSSFSQVAAEILGIEEHTIY